MSISSNVQAKSPNHQKMYTEQSENPEALDSVKINQGQSSNTDDEVQVITMPTPTESQKSAKLTTSEVEKPTPLPGNRPIASSNFQVRETISEMGERPIASSNLKVLDVITESGNRPITSSSLQFVEGQTIMGNRPIASNKIDDEDLMGYID